MSLGLGHDLLQCDYRNIWNIVLILCTTQNRGNSVPLVGLCKYARVQKNVSLDEQGKETTEEITLQTSNNLRRGLQPHLLHALETEHNITTNFQHQKNRHKERMGVHSHSTIAT